MNVVFWIVRRIRWRRARSNSSIPDETEEFVRRYRGRPHIGLSRASGNPSNLGGPSHDRA